MANQFNSNNTLEDKNNDIDEEHGINTKSKDKHDVRWILYQQKREMYGCAVCCSMIMLVIASLIFITVIILLLIALLT